MKINNLDVRDFHIGARCRKLDFYSGSPVALRKNSKTVERELSFVTTSSKAGESRTRISHCRGKKLRNIGVAAPILRRWSDTPQISWAIQRYANQPILASAIQRNTAGNSRRDCAAAGHIVYAYLQAWSEWPGEAHSAALRIHHQRVAIFGECARWIETADAHRDLCSHSRTAPPLASTVQNFSKQRIVCSFTSQQRGLSAGNQTKVMGW